MDQIAFQIGSFNVYWYGVFAALGFLAGFWTASLRAPLAGVRSETVLDLAPWLIVGALVGARLWYVVTFWDEQFAQKPLTEIFMLRHGGVVWYGGFIGASIAVILFARAKKLALWTLADIFAPSVALGHAFGRVGCFMNGCCFGRACEVPWGVRYPDGHETEGEKVHPAQLYEAGLNLFLYLALAWVFRRRKFEGQVFALYLICYAFVRTFVETFRGDYANEQYVGRLFSPGQVVSVAIFAAGVTLWWVRQRKPLLKKPDQ